MTRTVILTTSLTPDDLVVKDKNGKVPTDANDYDQDSNPYYISLKDSVLSQLNGQNKNYTFQIGDTYARYTIQQYKSKLNLSGKQFVDYGSDTMPALDPSQFTLTYEDETGATQTIHPAASDLQLVVPTGTPTDSNGMPLNAGQYVVEVSDSFIKQWNKDHPNYKLNVALTGTQGSKVEPGGDVQQANTNAWYVVKHRQVAYTINNTPEVTYNGQAASIKDGDYKITFGPVSGVTASGVISRDQTAFGKIKWTADDFEFVNGAPTNAGTYQVRLSQNGLQKLQDFSKTTLGSNYDFSGILGTDAAGKLTSPVTADYKIDQMPLTVKLNGSLSHEMGDYTLPVSGKYTVTITTQDGKTVMGADGQPLNFTYTLSDGDVVYEDGIPSAVGDYPVKLSSTALSKIEQKYGTDNFTYNVTSDAMFHVTQGEGTLTITGSQTVPYTGKAATIDGSQYQLVIHTNIGDITEPASAFGLVFYQKGTDGQLHKVDNPINVGTYVVGINPSLFSTIESYFGGKNYKWSESFNTTYTITAVAGTATGNYTNNRDYNGSAIGELNNIQINLDYPGSTSSNNTYTLRQGDYELVGPDGTVYTDPTAIATANAGTYTIKLTQQGKDYINQHFGNVTDASDKITSQNVKWTFGDGVVGSYTINPVRMMVTVGGNQTTTYNGQPYGADGALKLPTVTLGTKHSQDAGVTIPTIPTTGPNALTADDFTITEYDDPTKIVTNPTAAGHYRVYLKQNGYDKLAKLSSNFVYPTAGEVTSYGLLTINPQDVTVHQGSAGKTFNAQTTGLTADQFAQYKKAITDVGYNADNLTVNDLDWWFDTDHLDYGTQDNPTNPIKDAGQYCLRLNDHGKQVLAQDNPNYDITVDDFIYHIYPEVVHIGLNGTQNTDWDNQAVAVNSNDFTPTFTVYGGANGDELITNPVRDDGTVLTIPAGVNLTADDYEFVDSQGNVINNFTRGDGTTAITPFKVGTYHVRLTEAGWKKLATQSTDNVQYQYGDGTVKVKTPTNTIGTVNIQQVTPKISLNGGNWKTYDGQPVSYDQTIYENGDSKGRQLINASFTINGQTINLPLSADDLIWTSNGQDLKTAPSAAGIYGVRLNKDKFVNDIKTWVGQHSDYAGAMKLLANNIDGSASYEIKALNIAKIEAQPDKGTAVYNGQQAKISLSDLAGKIHATDANGKVWTLSTNGLTLADFSDAKGHVYTSFPLNVGEYTFTLNSDGINVLQTNNPNFTIPNTVSSYSYFFKITPAEATAKLSGSAEKTYDGQHATTDEINGGTSTIAVSIGANKTIYYTLQDGDYDWYSQDGKTKLTGGAPTNAGTYIIKLDNDKVLTHLKAKIASDSQWTVQVGNETITNVTIADKDLSGFATFTINKANAQLNMDGTIQRTYTGSQIAKPVSDLQNDINAGVLIGNDQISTSGLTVDDFDWVDANGNPVTGSQINAGTYYIKLNQNGLKALESGLTTNYNWSINTNLVKVNVVPAAATVSINGSKIYDGKKVSGIAGKLQASGLIGHDSLNTDGLTDADFTWSGVEGALTDAGTYNVVLTSDGLKQLRKDNPNYTITVGSDMTYTIKKAVAQVAISGDNISTDPTINQSKYTLTLNEYPGQETVPASGTPTTINLKLTAGDLTYVDADGNAINTPTHPGDYSIGLTTAALERLQNDPTYKNYNISRGPIGTVHLQGIIHYIFQDADDGNKQVGETVTKAALPSDGEQNSGLALHANYELAAGQTLPTSFTITSSDPLTQTVYIKLVHKTETIDENDIPSDGKNIDGTDLTQDNFTKNIKRTITAKEPDGTNDDLSQTTTLTRTATYDLVTKKVTQWVNWSTGSFDAVTAPTVAGYTPHPASVAADNNVTSDYTDPKIVITYTANDQTGKISYVDQSGNEIGKTTLTGKTGENVTVTPQIPAGWEEVSGQTIPATVKAGPNGIPTVKITIKHGTITVDPTDPKSPKIPTGPVPGNHDKSYDKVTNDDLTRKITRIITVNVPNGTPITKTQTVTFDRTATFDNVTGKVTYGNWTAKDGKNTWDAYTPQAVAGYAPDTNLVAAETVTEDTKDQTITINYVANDQTAQIIYVDSDEDNKQVGTQDIAGKVDQTVDITYQVPDNYELYPDAPKTYKFTNADNQTMTVHLKHKMQDVTRSQTITETVHYTGAGSKTPSDNTQTITITENGVKDMVTGATKWTAVAGNFNTVNTPDIPGYMADVASIPATIVNYGDGDINRTVTYTANDQTGKISYVDQGGKKISQTVLTGKTDQTVDVTPSAPAGWQIIPGQNIPNTVTATSTGLPTVIVQIEHKTITVGPDDTKPTGPLPGDPTKDYPTIKDSDLAKDTTRTIVVTAPDGTKTTTTQKVHFTQTATIDEVTGDITYSGWTVDGNKTWAEFTPTAIAGYKPSQDSVPAVTVDGNTADAEVDISYVPISDSQSAQVIYVDDDNNGTQVGSVETINGDKGETVGLNLQAPTNYVLVKNQPTTYTFTDSANQVVKIHLLHHKTDVSKTDSSAQTTVTRTIIVQAPDGTSSTIPQSVTLTRTAVRDDVTGVVTYGQWSTGQLDAWTAPSYAGYTPSQTSVAVMPVTHDTASSTVTITYTPNAQQMGYQFVDDDNHGAQVGSLITINGKTAQTVDVHLTIPDGYALAKGQTLPTTYTFGISNPTVQIHLVHQTKTIDGNHIPNGGQTPDGHALTKDDFQKNIKRTITAEEPSGNVDLSQTTTLTRNAIYDLVTGKVTKWGDWSTSHFDAVDAPAVDGYTPNQATVPAVATVGSDYVDPHIVITYTANFKPVNPTTPVNPTGPTTPVNPTGPTTPPTSPTNPSTLPTSPTTAPTTPATLPTSPTTAPTNPSTVPTSPTTAPTTPSTTPLNPDHPGGNGGSIGNGNGGDATNHGGRPSTDQSSGINVMPGEGAHNIDNGSAARGLNSVADNENANNTGQSARTRQLPQTGNDKSQASTIGFVFAGLASMLGLAGLKKKKRDQQ